MLSYLSCVIIHAEIASALRPFEREGTIGENLAISTSSWLPSFAQMVIQQILPLVQKSNTKKIWRLFKTKL